MITGESLHVRGQSRTWTMGPHDLAPLKLTPYQRCRSHRTPPQSSERARRSLASNTPTQGIGAQIEAAGEVGDIPPWCGSLSPRAERTQPGVLRPPDRKDLGSVAPRLPLWHLSH
jgi:hypothetical protein